ncbi:pyridoxal-phosphate dependent enzyme [Bradyrhizobium sp. 35]|uniref:pyridoxal-phosphate dependent enzyme n=1 Tax=Bradyrhizobium sp. 35 TaxID=2782670 RepID=UPI001FFA46BC
MAGYGVTAAEIRDQVDFAGLGRPTHVFIQAGVGGLAAAIAEGLSGWLASPGCIVTVEPETAACLAPALAAGRPIRVMGDLRADALLRPGECGRRCGAQASRRSRHHRARGGIGGRCPRTLPP